MPDELEQALALFIKAVACYIFVSYIPRTASCPRGLPRSTQSTTMEPTQQRSLWATLTTALSTLMHAAAITGAVIT